MLTTTTKIRVAFDAAYDLAQGSHDTGEAKDFAAAWEGAFGWLVEELGLEDCQSIHARHGSPDAYRQTSTTLPGWSEDIEHTIWQLAHDMCSRDNAARVGDRWSWREPRQGVVERLRGLISVEKTT